MRMNTKHILCDVLAGPSLAYHLGGIRNIFYVMYWLARVWLTLESVKRSTGYRWAPQFPWWPWRCHLLPGRAMRGSWSRSAVREMQSRKGALFWCEIIGTEGIRRCTETKTK
jgi:hypothetical protein